MKTLRRDINGRLLVQVIEQGDIVTICSLEGLHSEGVNIGDKAVIKGVDECDEDCPIYVEFESSETEWLYSDNFKTCLDWLEEGHKLFKLRGKEGIYEVANVLESKLEVFKLDSDELSFTCNKSDLSEPMLDVPIHPFKEGDLIMGLENNGYSITNEEMTVGKVTKVDGSTMNVVIKHHTKDSVYEGMNYWVTNKANLFQLIQRDKEPNKEKIVDIANRLVKVYVAKNADYGDSFNKGREVFGQVGGEVRISDKILRFEALVGKEEQAKVQESLEDTVLDLINYVSMHRVSNLSQTKAVGEIYNNIVEMLCYPREVLEDLNYHSTNLQYILTSDLITKLTIFITNMVGR